LIQRHGYRRDTQGRTDANTRQDEDGPLPGERRTRLSGAWTAIVIGLLALVVILIFILQNQQSVQISS